tara:strand:+ start:165 stop:368 length:204 start_codon:yes stop_codon:yes gene_type:complete
MEELIKIIKSAFEEDIEIDIEKQLSQYSGWDSLTAFVIIDLLEEKYSISIDPEILENLSVKDLFEKI